MKSNLLIILGFSLSCNASPQAAARSERAAAAALPAPPPPPAPLPDERARVPEGSFSAGTEAGHLGRRPELEPRLERVALGAFEMDVWPYPGGTQPAQVGLPRARARELCETRGGRLCTELEWERACKGPESQNFPGGQQFDPVCAAQPGGCRSGFGVYGLGNSLEWTASDLGTGAQPPAVLRGATSADPPELHRCARRSSAPASEARTEIGFRCCYGPPNAARVSIPPLGTTFRKLDLPIQELERLLRQAPATERLASEVTYFPEPAAESVLAKGPGDRRGFLLTVAPLLWNPVRGAEFLVVSARSGATTSFVVVYHLLGETRYQLASSFVMQNEPGPVALAFNGYIRPRLHFSSCWGCPGETGKILYREPDAAVILQP